MARQANGSLRDATDHAASSTDDVDLGWDEVLASTTEPPPAVEGASPKFSEIRALSSSSQSVASAHQQSASDPTSRAELGGRELDPPNFRRHQVGPSVIILALGSAAVLIVASVATSHFPRVAARRPEPVAIRAHMDPVAQPLPEPQSPEPAPPAAVTTRAASPASLSGPPAEAAPATAVTVTVKVIPESSVIFRAGKRLGTGTIELGVERGAKERLTALHDGFLPSSFTLDGSRDAVTVRLRRVPPPEPAAPPESDSSAETDQ